jgi:hypothetical protein
MAKPVCAHKLSKNRSSRREEAPYFHKSQTNTACDLLSLAPGFSPVSEHKRGISCFNSFEKDGKAVETAEIFFPLAITWLKPGANDKK